MLLSRPAPLLSELLKPRASRNRGPGADGLWRCLSAASKVRIMCFQMHMRSNTTLNPPGGPGWGVPCPPPPPPAASPLEYIQEQAGKKDKIELEMCPGLKFIGVRRQADGKRWQAMASKDRLRQQTALHQHLRHQATDAATACDRQPRDQQGRGGSWTC
jgi:hypothetical protein